MPMQKFLLICEHMKMQISGEKENEQWQEYNTYRDDNKDVMNYARNITSGTGKGTGDSFSDSSKWPHSIVWKFLD